MLPCGIRSGLVAVTFMVAASSVSAQYDYSHRKSKCEIEVSPNTNVKATLIRNHFGFGGAMNWYLHDTINAEISACKKSYGDAFLDYFDYCTPENEMKWDYVMGGDEEPDPLWWKADTIINFCHRNDIKIRGHNLFWNEDTCWVPAWAWSLPTKAEFKEAMKQRIEDAMTYGVENKVVHWDIINEIIHGYKPGTNQGGYKPAFDQLTLVKYSGDNNIFQWILEEARKIDKTSLFTINDYGLEGSEQDCKDYIARCQPFKDKFEIIGIEGHFGTNTNGCSRNNLNARINQLADGLNNEVWFTEVDWEFAENQSPAKMEELMRTAFSNPKVGGIVIWTWIKRHMWRDKLTNFFVDSLVNETNTGKKWREVRQEWKTDTSGTADGDGKFKFTGYQGKYRVLFDGDTLMVYLHPGDSVEILHDSRISAIRPATRAKSNPAFVRLGGKVIRLSVAPDQSGSLYLSTYSISGKLISRLPLNFVNGTATVAKLPSGCHVYRIGNAGSQLYTGLGLTLR